MSPESVGIVGIVILLLLFMLRMPVAFTMAFVGFAGFAYLNGMESALTLLAQDVYDTLSSYPLSVIPMFILMGAMAYASGISQRLYRTCYTWLGQFRGGLTVATVDGLFGLCRHQRLHGCHSRHYGRHRPAGDEKVWLRRPARHRHRGFGRHPGYFDPSQHGAYRLRHPHRGVHRQAVHRRCNSRSHSNFVVRLDCGADLSA